MADKLHEYSRAVCLLTFTDGGDGPELNAYTRRVPRIGETVTFEDHEDPEVNGTWRVVGVDYPFNFHFAYGSHANHGTENAEVTITIEPADPSDA